MIFLKRPKKIGLALSGGGARGLAHIGVIEVLEEKGIEISAVAGTSMGAVVGSLYALGVSIKEILDFMNSNDWKRFVISSNFTIPNLISVNSRKVGKLLSKLLGDKTFNDCKIPFCSVAADAVSKDKVYIKEGRLIDAVRASIAIPGIFEPLISDGRILVDGGVVEPVPVEAVKNFDVNFIIAAALNNLEKTKTPDSKLSLFTLIGISLSMMEREMSKHYLESADIIIEPSTGNFGVFEFSKALEIINVGREAAKSALKKIH